MRVAICYDRPGAPDSVHDLFPEPARVAGIPFGDWRFMLGRDSTFPILLAGSFALSEAIMVGRRFIEHRRDHC